MRVVLAVLVLSMFMCADALAGGCVKDKPETLAPRNGQAASEFSASLFRGIGLSNQPEELRWITQSLGFDTATSYYVGDTSVSGIDICSYGHVAGHADFDRQGRMLRLSLKDRFFYDKPVFVLDFAEDVFKTYGVKPLETADDVCFQDITCFMGVSKYGEQFLIMRFGTEAELFVRPSGRPED
jgi:hypothetical protein